MRPLIKKIQEITKRSIREIFEISDDNIIFCKNFAHKLQIMREKRISVLIEDNLNSDPIPDDMMVIVLKRIWNSKKEINNPRIKVVEGWDEILKLLL
jgi:hypothetical protein